jgi:hypothetical protein
VWAQRCAAEPPPEQVPLVATTTAAVDEWVEQSYSSFGDASLASADPSPGHRDAVPAEQAPATADGPAGNRDPADPPRGRPPPGTANAEAEQEDSDAQSYSCFGDTEVDESFVSAASPGAPPVPEGSVSTWH